jgi:hypothetical protein
MPLSVEALPNGRAFFISAKGRFQQDRPIDFDE